MYSYLRGVVRRSVYFALDFLVGINLARNALLPALHGVPAVGKTLPSHRKEAEAIVFYPVITSCFSLLLFSSSPNTSSCCL